MFKKVENTRDCRFSVIIPTLNEQKYIEHLLKDLSKQTIKPYEVIVADANSTDNTTKIAKQYKAKVIKGGTPAQGRNAGAKAANGDFLVFLDADVRIPKNFLYNLCKEFKNKNTELIVLKFRTEKLGADQFNIIRHLIGLLGKTLENFYRRLEYLGGTPRIGTGLIAVRTTAFNKIGGYNTKVKYSEDYDFILKLIKSNNKKFKNYKFLNLGVQVSYRRFTKLKVILGSIIAIPFFSLVELVTSIKHLEKFRVPLRSSIMTLFYGKLGGKTKLDLKKLIQQILNTTQQ